MLLWFELIVLCLLLFLICYLGTGSDEKNIRNSSFRCYPDEVQRMVRENPAWKDKIRTTPSAVTFLSNLLLFGALLLLCGVFIRTDSFSGNFFNLLILGQGLNAFDFFVIDLLWWRNTKRVRLTGTEDRADLYRDPRKHFVSFLRGIALFLAIAVIDGWVLSLF